MRRSILAALLAFAVIPGAAMAKPTIHDQMAALEQIEKSKAQNDRTQAGSPTVTLQSEGAQTLTADTRPSRAHASDAPWGAK